MLSILLKEVEICRNMRSYLENNTNNCNPYHDKRACLEEAIRLYLIYLAWKVMKNEVMIHITLILHLIHRIPWKKQIQKKKLANKNIKMIRMVVLFITLINLKKLLNEQETQMWITIQMRMNHLKKYSRKREKTSKVEERGESKNGNALWPYKQMYLMSLTGKEMTKSKPKSSIKLTRFLMDKQAMELGFRNPKNQLLWKGYHLLISTNRSFEITPKQRL